MPRFISGINIYMNLGSGGKKKFGKAASSSGAVRRGRGRALASRALGAGSRGRRDNAPVRRGRRGVVMLSVASDVGVRTSG